MSHKQISKRGIELIKAFEALRLEAYKDVVGVWTIGYGHTRHVCEGMCISEEEAEAMLADDLSMTIGCVNDCCPLLGQNEFDACVSLAFNVGCHAFRKSTLVKRIHVGDFDGAANEFVREERDENGNIKHRGWVHAGGKVVKGLVRRRQAEKALFLEEDCIA